MRKHLFMMVVAALALTGCQSFYVDRPVVIADRLYWAGCEGEKNEAYNFVAKFNSQSQLAEALRFDAPIGKFAGRSWTMADILVRVDLNANGDVAAWMVSGPQPLISAYVTNLRQLYEKKKLMYEFSASKIDAKPTAFFEKEEE